MSYASQFPAITVTGEAEIKIPANEILIAILLKTFDPESVNAKLKNNQLLLKLNEAIQPYAIEQQQIKIDYLSVQPEFVWKEDGSSDFTGYSAYRNLVITFKDISQFDDLYDAILKAGVDHIEHVEFRTTESRKFQDQARILAIRAAKEKAEALANELNQAIGKPLSIQENKNELTTWKPLRSRYNNPSYANALVSVENSNSAGSLASGQVSINAIVTVSFELVDQ